MHSASADDAVPEGQPFGGYILIDELGQGAMGVVWRAWHKGLRRYCAIKMLHTRVTDDIVADRFIKEGRRSAKLGKHPNIVQVFDAGVVEGVPYMAMEMVRGIPLDKMVRARGQMPVEELLEIGRKIALALDHAHRRGIVHRDMKPGNVIIDEEGEPQVLDFGLAKDLTEGVEQSMANTIMGTPAYMPPEQADPMKGRVDHRADIYSLGATLYHALAAKMPFRAESVMDTIIQVLTQDAPPLRQQRKDISRDVQAIVDRSMEKQPQHRYQTALELADDLSRVLTGEAPKTRPVGPFGRLWRKVMRRPGVTIAVLVAVTAIAAVSAWTYYRGKKSDALWKNLSGQISRATSDEVRSLLEPALPLLEEHRTLAEAGFLPVGEPEELGKHLAVRFRYRKRLDWLSYGDAEGRFVGAKRTKDGKVLLHRSWLDPDGKGHMREELIAEDFSKKPVRSSDEWTYDPRERPFYELAAKRFGVAWTEPYEWWDAEGIGITATIGLTDDAGDQRGAFTADFSLAGLTDFLKKLDIGVSGEAFVLTRQGRVLAGPHKMDFKEGRPELDAALEALPEKLADAKADEPISATFEHDGTEYLAAAEVFDIAGGLEWATVVVVPLEDLGGGDSALLKWTLVGGGATIGVALLFGLFGALRRRGRAKRTAADAKAAGARAA